MRRRSTRTTASRSGGARRSSRRRSGRERVDLSVLAELRRIENDVSEAKIEESLVRSLPELVAKMPAPQRSEHVHIGGDASAPDGVVAIAGLVKAVRSVLKNGAGAGDA